MIASASLHRACRCRTSPCAAAGFQRRLITLLALAKARTYDDANRFLAMEIDRQNTSVHGPTKQVPADVLLLSQGERRSALRPCPPASLLDLHFSLRGSRRVSNDHCIEFDGRRFQIAPTSKKHVSILFHPNSGSSNSPHPPSGPPFSATSPSNHSFHF